MEAIGLKNSTLLLYNYNSSSTGALPLLPPLLPLPLCTTAAKSRAYLTPLSSSSASSSSSSSSSWKLSMLRTTTTATKTPTATRRMKRSGPEVVRKSTITCCGGGAMIKNINESEFASVVLESERPVLVEFVADWCGPCRLISPSMEWAAQEYRDRLMIVKIDHDANPQLIQKYEVYGLPTLILFKNGQEVPTSRKEGAITKVKLKNYLDVLLDSVSVA